MRLRTKAAREAAVILGSAAVARAVANRDAVTAYLYEHPGEVRAAIKAIVAYLPSDVTGATAYASTLAPELRTALAGAWADRAAPRVLAGIGLEEQHAPT
jgi:urease accessory protein UreF